MGVADPGTDPRVPAPASHHLRRAAAAADHDLLRRFAYGRDEAAFEAVVARHAVLLAERYAAQYPDLTPPLNRDLVLAGAVLHDIGRVREFDPDVTVPTLGIDGELFGHLLLGVELLRDAARDVPNLNPELLRLLEHLIYTHRKIPEWSSPRQPRLPAIPEVLIVHHADDLDAKFEMYARCLMKDTADGPFTERDPQLGRPLYKGRTV